MLSTIIDIMLNKFKITGIILAGGKSSRMGTNKALLSYKGKSLIEHNIALIKPFCSEILISNNNNDFNELGYNIVKDNYFNVGPLAGIEACLRKSSNEINFIISCDLVVLSKSVISSLIEKCNNDVDAIIPLLGKNTLQPLCAIYKKKILFQLIYQIEKGDYAVYSLLNYITTQYVTINDSFDLLNINTPDDYNFLINNFT